MAEEPARYSQHDIDALTERVAGQQRLVMALIGFLTAHHVTEKTALIAHIRRVAERSPDLPGGDVLSEICDLLERDRLLN